MRTKSVSVLAVAILMMTFPLPSNASATKGKQAICSIDDATKSPCTFIPQEGNGSFEIITDNGPYYAEKVATDIMDFTFDNGARIVEQGRFIRSKDDRACWIKKDENRRICVW